MNPGFGPMTRTKPVATASAVLTGGAATEMARVFVAGSPVAPFSVGTCGDWRVTASGVEAQHFYLCFDGCTLFAARAAAGPVTAVAGKRLNVSWTELRDGCVLSFGSASIAVTNLGQRMPRARVRGQRADPRGPRLVDPFACETLARARLSPLARATHEAAEELTVVRSAIARLETLGVASDPLDEATIVRPASARPETPCVPRDELEEPTLWRRAGARELALEPFVRVADVSLANTLIRPVTAPLAVTVSAPVPSRVAGRFGLEAASSAPAGGLAVARTSAALARTALLRKCMAGLVVAALVLAGVRVLSRRQRISPVRAPAAALSASSRSVVTVNGIPSARTAVADETPSNAELAPLATMNGKTPERQAVDLVARGAYGEAAALYDRLVRVRDIPVFREAARIARRKARLSR